MNEAEREIERSYSYLKFLVIGGFKDFQKKATKPTGILADELAKELIEWANRVKPELETYRERRLVLSDVWYDSVPGMCGSGDETFPGICCKTCKDSWCFVDEIPDKCPRCNAGETAD